MVHKYELKLKQYARKNNLLVDRGDERILIRLSKLMKILEYQLMKKETLSNNSKKKYLMKRLNHLTY